MDDKDLLPYFDDDAIACDDASRLRSICAADLCRLIAIEQESFEFPWTREDFEYCLRTRTCGGFVVERDNSPIGYLFYETRPRSIRLLSCAVAPSARRQGLGAKMARKLISKIDEKREKIVCVVRERNVPAQLFLRKMGFRAIWVSRNYYEETSEDAYRMAYLPNRSLTDEERLRRRLLSR